MHRNHIVWTLYAKLQGLKVLNVDDLKPTLSILDVWKAYIFVFNMYLNVQVL